jgi:hypothetical protein
MRASLERHMEMRVLRPETRMFCFLPQRVAARDDSGAAEGACLLIAGGEGALVGEGAGVVAEVPTVVAAGGGGGTVGPHTT